MMVRLTPVEVSLIARIAQGAETADGLRDVRDKFLTRAMSTNPRLIRNEEYVRALTDDIIAMRHAQAAPDGRNVSEGAQRIVGWAYTNRRLDND